MQRMKALLCASETLSDVSLGCLFLCRPHSGTLLMFLWVAQIDRRDQFDQIVIETTGLANPAPIINTLMAHNDMQENIRLDGVVTLVDAKHVEQHLDDKEMSEEAVNEAVEQIAYADRILLNKVDLVSLSRTLYNILSCILYRRHIHPTNTTVTMVNLLLCLPQACQPLHHFCPHPLVSRPPPPPHPNPSPCFMLSWLSVWHQRVWVLLTNLATMPIFQLLCGTTY